LPHTVDSCCVVACVHIVIFSYLSGLSHSFRFTKVEKLPEKQQQQLKKMSDERLHIKLVAYGYEEEAVLAWESDELLARYAEVVKAGASPRVEPVVVDPELEKVKLDLERKRLELEERRMAQEKLEKEKYLEVERQKAEIEKQKIESKKETESQRLEFEKKKAEFEHKKWVAEQEFRRAQLKKRMRG